MSRDDQSSPEENRPKRRQPPEEERRGRSEARPDDTEPDESEPDEEVAEAIDESFPASDPPSWTRGRRNEPVQPVKEGDEEEGETHRASRRKA